MASIDGGKGKKRGGGAGRRRGGSEGGNASPEWLPPQQRREQEAETRRATRSITARRIGGGTQEFLDRPEVRQAAGLAAELPASGGGDVIKIQKEEEEKQRRNESALPSSSIGSRVISGCLGLMLE